MELKVNADLVGVVVNLASRTAKFANMTGCRAYPEDGGLFAEAASKSEEIANAYEERDFGKAIRTILECGYRANQYVENQAPWTLKKEWTKLEKDDNAAQESRDAAKKKLQDVVTVSLNLFRQIVVYLSPILPDLAKKTEELLNTKIENWNDAQSPILGSAVNEYKHMMTRVPKEGILAMIEESKETLKPMEQTDQECPAASNTEETTGIAPWFDSPQSLIDEPLCETITIDDFMKVDLRVGRIIEAEEVKEARKLLKLIISLGGTETRQVFAGVKAAYPEPEKLIGRLVVFVANLTAADEVRSKRGDGGCCWSRRRASS